MPDEGDITEQIEANKERAAKLLAEQEPDPSVTGPIEDFSDRPTVDLAAADRAVAAPEGEPDAEGEAVQVPEDEAGQEGESGGDAPPDAETPDEDEVADKGSPEKSEPPSESVTFVSERPSMTVMDPKSSKVVGKFTDGKLTVSNPAHVRLLDSLPGVRRAVDDEEDHEPQHIAAVVGEVVLAFDEGTNEFVRARVVAEG